MYGEQVLEKPVNGRCSIVKLMLGSEKTSVRADSSASRGNASEIVADARLLFPIKTDVRVGDKVDIDGYSLEVKSVFPRHDMSGRKDHYQVDADIWA